MTPKTSPKFDDRGFAETSATNKATLLIEAILEEYCSLYTQNQEQYSHALYQALRSQLRQWNVLPADSLPTDKRMKYRHYLRRIVALTMQQISEQEKRDVVDGHTRYEVLNTVEELPEMYLERQITATSRFEAEYTDIEYLAKGGFGRVFRAKHILDGNVYAIKSIPIKTGEKSRILKTLREIQTLARLHHPNIVSYKNAWLEVSQPEPPLSAESRPRIVELSSTPEKRAKLKPLAHYKKTWAIPAQVEPDDREISCDIEFGDGDKPDTTSERLNNCDNAKRSESVESSRGFWKKSSAHESFSNEMGWHFSNAESSGEKSVDVSCAPGVKSCELQRHSFPLDREPSSGASNIVFSASKNDEKGDCNSSFKRSARPSDLRKPTLVLPSINLFIAMQFCDGTLREWLRQRDRSNSPVDPGVSFQIFGQILEGLKYIHENGMIHRDLKPDNIFFNHSIRRVQIGDFGLARFLPGTEASPLTPLALASIEDSRLTRGLGTQSYAAPEQIAGGRYDQKCDIYSLGYILVELFEKFFTDYSRFKCFENLRKGIAPQSLLQRRPLVAQLVLEMTDKRPETRPSADEVLQRIRLVYSSSLQNEWRALAHPSSELELD